MKKTNYHSILRLLEVTFLVLFLGLVSCEDHVEPSPAQVIDCTEAQSQIFQEANGLLTIDLENTEIPTGWCLENSIPDFTGTGYLQWTNGDQFGNPGQGLLTYRVQISTPGTYRVQIRAFIAEGDDHTESNDVWIRIADADDFFAQKNNSLIYPHGSGKSPNPNGAGKEGWFKSYMSQLDQWSWQTRTSDHDAHDIFVTFNQIGTYTLELSGRSQGFAVDRIVLYKNDLLNEASATQSEQTQSNTTCQL